MSMAHGGQAARREQLNNFLGADFEDEGEEGSVHRVTNKYGSSDPWGTCEGGLDGIVDILVSSNTDLVLPPLEEGDLPFAGLLMGDLVARSSLNNAQKSAVKTFIRLVRHPVLALYEEAFKMAAAESGGVHSKENEALERLAEQVTGMQAREAKALVMAMAIYALVPAQELDAMVYGMDPLGWSGFKNIVKYGGGSYLEYKKQKADPMELRARLKKTARILRDGKYSLASATLTSFIDDLEECTFDEGVPQYFLEYYNEFMEQHRCRGLIVSAPLDQVLVRRKVLCRRSGGGGGPGAGAAGGASVSAVELATMRLQLDEKDREHRRVESQAASLRDQLRRVKEGAGGSDHDKKDDKHNPKPGEGGAKCYECGSLEHFGSACPKRVARLAKEGAAGSDAGKDKTA